MALGGADVAWAADPLGAMTENPAGLATLTRPELDLAGEGGILVGKFNKPSVGSSGNLDGNPLFFPSGAAALPLEKWPVTFGISVAPESTLVANWRYPDPPSTGGISYGQQQDESKILVLRSAVGVGVKFSDRFSVGLSGGVLYNRNTLVTPYIFQNLQGPLAGVNGAKTLLDLHTTGIGWDLQAGMIFRATTNLQFGASYTTESVVHSDGTATGDPYAQFHGAPGPLAFQYDAAVKNVFPQVVRVGASWKFHPQWRGTAQVDWLGWGDAFHSLSVNLSNGHNGAAAVLGPNVNDTIPLDWRNEFVYRAGLEFDPVENLALRLGYSYGHSPVPDGTLTPMTAGIFEHTLTAGVGYRWRCVQFDLAYQYYFPVTQSVGTSSLLAGEYSNSSTTVSAHVISLGMGITF